MDALSRIGDIGTCARRMSRGLDSFSAGGHLRALPTTPFRSAPADDFHGPGFLRDLSFPTGRFQRPAMARRRRPRARDRVGRRNAGTASSRPFAASPPSKSRRRTGRAAGPFGRSSTTCPTATSTRTVGSSSRSPRTSRRSSRTTRARWAELADVKAVPIETSLTLLDVVHERWIAILRAMKPSDFERMLVHPESRPPESRPDARALRVARSASHRARDDAARAHGLVASLSACDVMA